VEVPEVIGSEPGDAGVEAVAASTPALELRGITKRFGSVVACDAVDLAVGRGEIHGLLGQNGAGKSTAMKILLGLYSADAGQIRLHGEPVVIRDPLRAAELGLAMVHQHFSVVRALTVWENVTLGERGRVDVKRAIRDVETIGERYGLDVDPRACVADLTTGQRQRVEIIKCLRKDPQVLILDEPTSVLTLAESDELFAVLRRVVKEEGKAVVLISHKLDEILHATDRVTIMRSGKVVAAIDTKDTTVHELAREMVGREVSLRSEAAALGLMAEAAEVALEEAVAEAGAVDGTEPGAPVLAKSDVAAAPAVAAVPAVHDPDVVLRISGACATASDGRRLLAGLDLEVRRGEILGLAGVEGNGQAALGNLMSGLIELDSGHIEVDGVVVGSRVGDMMRAGVGVIPEDRHESGCVLTMSVAENLALADLDLVSARGFVNQREIRARARRLVRQFDIMCASVDTPMGSLSGGNQQRVVLARELSRAPKVLVAAQPTRGLDVGAIEYMSQQLRAAADAGVAVLLISTELEEIVSLADRVAVIHRGRIMGVMPRAEVEVERLGLLMGGQAA
jgi:general nucleoside transport system ATP-binding protein